MCRASHPDRVVGIATLRGLGIVMDGQFVLRGSALQRGSDFARASDDPLQTTAWSQFVAASLPDMVIACDRSGTVRYESHKAAEARVAGTLPPLPVLLRKCLMAPPDAYRSASIPDLVETVLQSPLLEQGCSGSLMMRTAGGLAPWEVSAHALRDPLGRITGLLVRLQMLSANRNLIRKLMREASHDVLTDLPNRRELYERLSRLIEHHEPEAHHALLVMDLDCFKPVNDLCGHQAGDDALCMIASLLKAEVRSRDTLARLGGDEFCLLMEHCPLTIARRTARKLMAAVGNFAFVRGDRVFRFGLSVGIAPVSAHHVSPTCALRDADAACYSVKRRGGHGIAVAPAMAGETMLMDASR